MQGLVEVLKKEVPEAKVRFCVRHMYSNFHKLFKRLELKKKLWAAAKACTVSMWKSKMEEIKELNAEAFDWLMNVGKEERVACKPGNTYLLHIVNCTCLHLFVCFITLYKCWYIGEL